MKDKQNWHPRHPHPHGEGHHHRHPHGEGHHHPHRKGHRHLGHIHQELFNAIATNNYSVFFDLLNKGGVNVDAENGSKQTLLHVASLAPSAQFVELLLSRGANPYSLDGNGWTPLHYAAYQGRADIIQKYLPSLTSHNKAPDNNLLISLNAIIKQGRNEKANPGGNYDLTEQLINHKILFNYIEINDFSSFNNWVNNSNNVNINADNGSKQTLLHIASLAPSTQFVELLINRGADPNLVDGGKWTPIDYAAYQGRHDIIQKYWDLNASANKEQLTTALLTLTQGENAKINPNGDYAKTKQLIEQLINRPTKPKFN